MTKEELFRAVGEVREDQIAEAESVKRRSRPWRRYGAMAACLAVVLAGALALERLEDARRWRAIEESFQTAVETESAPDAGGGEAEKAEDAPEERADGETVMSGLDGAEYWTETQKRPASNCSVDVEIAELQGDLGEDQENRAQLGVSSCLAWLAPEEIFAMDTVIFRGVVEGSPRYYRIDMPGWGEYYCTVADVRVTDPIRGDLEEGAVYSLMYGGARGYMSLSTSGPLERLEAGSEAVFMPERTSPDTGWRTENGYFCYADLAELRIGEGIRFVFLDTGEGLEFSRSTYEEIAEAETLDEVADYLRRMTAPERSRPAQVPAEPQADPKETDPALLDPGYEVGGPNGGRTVPEGELMIGG